LNLYVYCYGNPVFYIDPSGYITEEEIALYEDGKMAPAAYSFLMMCTYNYYLSDTDEDREWWHLQAQNFRDTDYVTTGYSYWDGLIKKMKFKPSYPKVSKEVHFFRNSLNINFEWNDFVILNERLPDNFKWILLPDDQSKFHQFNAEDNRKYVSPCGHFEAVYTIDNILVDETYSPLNMGTYNYYGPNTPVLHTIFDIIPWINFGNTELDAAPINLISF